MAVYHFIFHAYRSWNADHPRGWVQHGEAGVKRASRELGAYRDGVAKGPGVRFSEEQQGAMVGYVREIGGRRGWWAVYAVSVDGTHVHAVVGWRGAEVMEKVRDTLKRVMGYLLSQAAGVKGKRWFSHGADEVPVREGGHLRYLMDEYLPGHFGVYWRREVAG